jgi:probable F420-dependent oxidoreductase
MKFSIKVPGMSLYPGDGRHWWRDISSREIIEYARTADRLGYDYLTVPEHFVMADEHVPEMGPRWVHSLSAAGFLLGATERIKIVCLIVVPYHNPIELAKAIATLHYVSGGRVILQAMVGYTEWEFELLKVPFKARGAITDEYLEAMQALWTQDKPRYSGEYVQFDGVTFDPRPGSAPTVWFGGYSRPALRRAARLGSGWISYATPRSEFPELVDYIQGFRPDRGTPFEFGLPLFEGERDWSTHRVIRNPDVRLDRDLILEQVDIITSLGATVTAADDVLGTGRYQNSAFALPAVTDLRDHLSRLEWFAAEVMPEVRRG